MEETTNTQMEQPVTEPAAEPQQTAPEPPALTAEDVSKMIADAVSASEKKRTEAQRLAEMTDQQRAETERDTYKQQLEALQKEVSDPDAEHCENHSCGKGRASTGYAAENAGYRRCDYNQNQCGSVFKAILGSSRIRCKGTAQRRTTEAAEQQPDDKRTDLCHSGRCKTHSGNS